MQFYLLATFKIGAFKKEVVHGMIIAMVRCMSKTVAITVWQDLVSPHYDASGFFLIIKRDGRRSTIVVKGKSLFEKAEILASAEVDTLICGALSFAARDLVLSKGIEIVSWVCGSYEPILVAYKQGANIQDSFSMPGCGHCRRRRRGLLNRGREF